MWKPMHAAAFSNGSRLLLAKGEGGKLTPKAVLEVIAWRNDIRYPKPRVITLTQATKLGTIYQASEIAAISGLAHHRLLMDLRELAAEEQLQVAKKPGDFSKLPVMFRIWHEIKKHPNTTSL
jgi:hypothetical protein